MSSAITVARKSMSKGSVSNSRRMEISRGKNPESSNAQGNVANTSDDGEILYNEVAIVSKDRRQLTDVWLVDLGVKWHMISHREWFHTYEHVSGGSVFIGNDYALEIVGIGTIKMKMYDDTIRTIQDM
ncbi:hypothetical protein PanWU01x14_240690 [Parasponia andersonii]|uniref:Retrovirus-related Pol polyprotein from transposon TNT 1-94-like beta-barrel domain-containing protein n=1 Tax=Parasponia andersonii TaxID=3476 RepID=A0A2P5BGS4_PARAD|nr:hypothetical protein PanWU01x14_240690 [Parasponia andersonii]